MASFRKNQSIADFQAFNHLVYGPIDDQLYSTADILNQVQRFAMRALKGVRKGNTETIRHNLCITYSWLNALANRFHIDLDKETWHRFPARCSYCGKQPCVCKEVKPRHRLKIRPDEKRRPKSISDFQTMFEKVYPSEKRSVASAGVHLAEEIGEVSEAVHNFLGEHRPDQFDAIKLEIADAVSCIFGLANSADIDFAKDLAAFFKNNCHVCHKAPCVCSFTFVAEYPAV